MKWLLLCFSLIFSFVVEATEKIRVGVYDFPPYAFVGDEITGVTAEMINVMNRFQRRFEFVMVPTTAERRYKDFKAKRFDMLIFESKSWGWLKQPVAVSKAFQTGAEIYIALAKKGRNETFFSDFKNKSMIGVAGYHYGFARFHSERDYLEKNFKILLTDSQSKTLKALFKHRGEIAVISQDYLNYHFNKHPRDKSKLLLSKKRDQTYRHTILLRKELPQIDIRDINQLMMNMKREGALTPLWQKYNMDNR